MCDFRKTVIQQPHPQQGNKDSEAEDNKGNQEDKGNREEEGNQDKGNREVGSQGNKEDRREVHNNQEPLCMYNNFYRDTASIVRVMLRELPPHDEQHRE